MVFGEKRNNEEENLLEKITTILLDVEGTTTSVSFVKDTLFPYVKENLESYVEAYWDDSEFKEDVVALKEQAKNDEAEKIEGFCPIEEGDNEKESLIKNILWQMSIDRKTTALKQLQGHIWREGYRNGKLKGHVYSDVLPVLKKWREENRSIYIFSSGSVEAQKLLFGHSEEGDLLEYISGHFDTTVGPKNESSSYEKIIKSLECDKDKILFLTDVVKEAEAARSAGIQTVVVVRENNVPLTNEEKNEFTTITCFNDLIHENSAKRKKISNAENDELVAEQKTDNEVQMEIADEANHADASENTDVDVENNGDSKPESTETTDKTGSKTEDENKTETEEMEIDLVNDDKKDEEENAENGTTNGEQSAPEEQQENEKEMTEPQVEVEEATPAVDPLDISAEKEQLNNGTNSSEELMEEEVNDTAPTGESDGTEQEVPEEKIIAKEGNEINGKTVYEEKEEKNGVSEEVEEEEDLKINKMVTEDKPEPTVEVNA